jgi:hypothetical protein
MGQIVRLGLLLVMATVWLPASTARADIFCWKDANGTPHFSNYNPPAQAEFCMVEHKPAPAAGASAHEPAVKPQPDPLQSQLSEANRQLKSALEKVDALSQKVDETHSAARSATEAAQRAEAEARAAGETRKEETVVFGVPYRGHYRPHPTPYYWHLDTGRYPYYNGPDKFRPVHHQGQQSGIAVQLRSGAGVQSGTIANRR